MSPERDDAPLAADSTRLLRSVMEECLDRVETDGLAVIDDVCNRHPEIAGHLRRRLRQLFDLGLLGDLPAASEREFPERLGEFRLLRCLGGGGMGVVYLAEQESLGRRVSLKLVRPEHLYFPGARERFHREAEAVARLKHPGIVAIHAVGEENGLPYFAMEWVEGATLAEAVKRAAESGRPRRGRDLAQAVVDVAGGGEPDAASGAFAGTWVQACVRVARDVARALDHAHLQGVLHRDVKPSNVMVTPAGRVLLLDFGLASLGDAEPITRSGSQLGSMAYMAPEQVRGEAERVDERTDVYSLGLTLYELLALRRPYSDGDVARLQMKIVTGDAPPLRRVAPDVPWDVETVCLKAMDPDPGRRYASAAELAKDLDNVLALRPIDAARAGLLRRAVKWTRRRPAAAVAIALTSLSLAVVPAVYVVVQARAAERVEGTLEAALDGIQTLLDRLSEPDLARVPEVVRLRREVLSDAAVLFRRIELTGADSTPLRLRLESLRVAVARLLGETGEFDAAVRAYGEAVERLDDIGTASADRIAADALAAAAGLLHGLGDVEAAEEQVRESMRRLGAGRPAEGWPEPLVRQWVHAREILASILFTTGRPNEAIALLEETAAAARRAGGAVAVSAAASFGSYLIERGDPERAEAVLEEASERGERLMEAGDVGPELVGAMIGVQGGLALVHQRAGRWETAESLLDKQVRTCRRLVERSPDRPSYHDRLVQCLLRLGELRIDRGRRDAAAETFREAASIERRLVQRFPDHIDFRVNLSSALGSLADLRAREAPAEARGLYDEAIGLLRGLVASSPRNGIFWMNLGLNEQGVLSLELGRRDPAAGVDAGFRAIDAFEQALALEPDHEWARGQHLATIRSFLLPLAEQDDVERLLDVAARLRRWHPDDASAERLAVGAVALAVEVDPSRSAEFLDALEEALESGALGPEDLEGRDFDVWREDPRFQELRERVGRGGPEDVGRDAEESE